MRTWHKTSQIKWHHQSLPGVQPMSKCEMNNFFVCHHTKRTYDEHFDSFSKAVPLCAFKFKKTQENYPKQKQFRISRNTICIWIQKIMRLFILLLAADKSSLQKLPPEFASTQHPLRLPALSSSSTLYGRLWPWWPWRHQSIMSEQWW